MLGDLMLDRYLWGTATRLSPEAAVPVVDFVEQSECLGGAGNVVANLAALGARVAAFGVIGEDEPGAALLRCLRQAAIADQGFIADKSRCNAKEAGFFVTRSLHDEKSFEEAGRALLAHFGCSAVVITRGEKGLSIFEESSPRHFTIPATSFEVTYARVGQSGVEREATGRQVFDVTGAGDTVLSVLSLAVAAGAALPDAAVLANTAAGVVVGKLGTASVTVPELAHALDDLRR